MKATFAAGCFWHVEEIFAKINGVISTEVGYTGGNKENPTYEDVCSDLTGHAEAVQIIFDPKKVSYLDLLKVFFDNHNPTTLNKQGPDVGKQYRSGIFFHDQEQEKIALDIIQRLNPDAQEKFGKNIVTKVLPASKFFRAEEYHQKYFQKMA